MNKAYTRINFQNSPSTATPLNATNLNKMDKAINDLDDRIIELQGYQEEAEEAAESASASASAASKAAETATADAEARVNAIIEGLEVYTKEESHKKFASVIKQTASGSPVLITDGAGANVLDFKGKGRSTQEQGNFYDGELLQGAYNTTNGNYGGATNYVCNKNMIPCKPNDTVSIAYEEVATYIFTLFYDSNGNFVSQLTSSNVNKANVTIPTNVRYVNFTIYKVGITPANAKKITVTVNGSASYPNPDYPQEIESVGDSGWFDGELISGLYDVSTGKLGTNNLYVSSKNPIPCIAGDKFKLVYGLVARIISFVYYDKDMNYITNGVVGNVSEYEITIPNNAAYIHFSISNNSSAMTTADAKKIVVTINDTYALQVKSVSKNLLNINERDKNTGDFSYTEYTNEIVKGSAKASGAGAFICSFSAYLEKGKRYIFSQESTSFSSAFIYADKLWGNNITSINVMTAPNYTHNADSGIYIIGYYGAITSGTEYSVVKPMLRRAEVTDGTYEPYKETVSYIPLDEPLRSIGNVTDEVGLTEVNRRFVEVVFDGINNTMYSAIDNNTAFARINNIGNNAICSHFSYCTNTNMGDNVSASSNLADGEFAIRNTVHDRFYFKKSGLTTLDEWNTWLQANPITVIYELAEPIVETIEPVDIATYNSVTYITATDNAEMEVTYAADTKCYIDSKFAELQAAIVNML